MWLSHRKESHVHCYASSRCSNRSSLESTPGISTVSCRSTRDEAAFATEPGSLAHGPPGVREALNGFISMNGKLDLEVTRVLEVDDLALVIGVWSFNGTGPDGEPVRLAARNADVLRRQTDGTWRFVIDNPWGTD